ncbi:hypothetical protein MsAg5_07880 [Methanosarcinaceae archaeon Ag5]|uniref:Isoprenylcysteine carboxylmethyltransferase family protein n=1 Tax=Methanolapillus africanus TaxID=3028297 RepID=A0AAE4MJR8_9EURY|nr:hypothetical protein [Methanosarcinaceae archaeon Ag5]
MKQLFSGFHERVILFLSQKHRQKMTGWAKAGSCAFESVFYLFIVPVILLMIGNIIFPGTSVSLSDGSFRFMMIFSILAALYGLLLMALCMRELWIYGSGSAAVNAPPQKLVTTGPYSLSRNPLVIGNLIYYAGIAFLISGSLEIFLLTVVITSVPAYFYHKYFEEPELEKAFGDEYADYKSRVPGLIPIGEKKPIQNLKQYFFRK